MGFVDRQYNRIRALVGSFPWPRDQIPIVNPPNKYNLCHLDLLFSSEILDASGDGIIMIEAQHEYPP